MVRTSLLAIALASAAIAFVPGVTHAADSRIAALLKKADTPFEVDKDGDYKIVINWQKEKRSQLVFVGGTPETISGITVYDIFAPARQVGEGGLSQADANELLKAGAGLKLGDWELRSDGAYFVAKVPADGLTSKQLDDIISLVAETADNYEEKISDGKSDDL